MNFIFDVDDTLYNQITPFLDAYNSMHFNYDIDVEALFKRSRQYSDEVFPLVSAHQMSIDESGVYRITKAFKDDGIEIPEAQALKLQVSYRENQGKISLSKVIRELIEFLKSQQIKIGIITNGPTQHQRNKINALCLEELFDEKNIFISGDYEYTKPDKRLFEIVEKTMKIKKEDTYYIGDSFENDMVGANNAGWKSIWLNRRGHHNISDVKVTYMVENEEELLKLIKKIVGVQQ